LTACSGDDASSGGAGGSDSGVAGKSGAAGDDGSSAGGRAGSGGGTESDREIPDVANCPSLPKGRVPNDTIDAANADVPMPPATPTATGLYCNIADYSITPGLLPFQPQFVLWSDGAEKSRWIYLPPGTKIDTIDPDHWSFPVGTRFWKEFRYGG